MGHGNWTDGEQGGEKDRRVAIARRGTRIYIDAQIHVARLHRRTYTYINTHTWSSSKHLVISAARIRRCNYYRSVELYEYTRGFSDRRIYRDRGASIPRPRIWVCTSSCYVRDSMSKQSRSEDSFVISATGPMTSTRKREAADARWIILKRVKLRFIRLKLVHPNFLCCQWKIK